MKKIIIGIIVVTILALALVGCGERNDVSYSDLNSMVDMEYRLVNLEVHTTMSGVTLVNRFWSSSASNGTMVTYIVEELATFDQMPDSDDYSVPEKMIVQKEGSATIKNGVIVEQDGHVVNIPVDSLQSLSVEFAKSYFSNTKSYFDNYNVFEGDVTNPRAFTGNQSFDGTNMHVTVHYNDKLAKMIIDYTTSKGATVKVIYTFG